MSQIKRLLLEKQEEAQELALVEYDYLHQTQQEAKKIQEKVKNNNKLEKNNGKSSKSGVRRPRNTSGNGSR